MSETFMTVLRTLEVIAESPKPLTNLELAKAVGAPPNTVLRHLRVLESQGLLARLSPGKRYLAAPRLQRLAQCAISSWLAGEPVRLALLELAERTGESAALCGIEAGEVTVTATADSQFPLRAHIALGSRHPLHCTAAGKVLLAGLGEVVRSKALRSTRLAAKTRLTLTSRQALEAELQRVQEAGYAISDEEYWPGLRSIAVPIPDTSGKVRTALSLHAPSARRDVKAMIEWLPALKSCARSIGERLRQIE